MPDLDELLDIDAHAWRSDVDRRMRAFVEPSPRHRVRTTVWSAASVAAIAVVVFAIAYVVNHPAREQGGGGTPGTSASCAGPRVLVTPRVVARGGTVTVHGEWFADGCNDDGGTAPPPIADVRLILIDAAHTYQLVTAHPSGDRYAFVVDVRIPADATPGSAVIDDSERVSSPALDRNDIRITR